MLIFRCKSYEWSCDNMTCLYEFSYGYSMHNTIPQYVTIFANNSMEK